MKKFVVLASMLVMLFSFTLTANAEISPSGTPVEPPAEPTVETTVPEPGETVVPPAPETNVSPKTGDEEQVLFYWGMAAAVLAAGAVVAGTKARQA